MASWKKVVVSGSSAELGNLKVSSLSSGVVTGNAGNLTTTAINGSGNIAATTGASGLVHSGSFSGSFQGDGSSLTGIAADSLANSLLLGNGISGGTFDGSSAITASVNADGSTLTVGASGVKVSDLGVDTAQLAANAVTNAKLANDSLRLGTTDISLGATGSSVAGLTLTGAVGSGSFSGSFQGDGSGLTGVVSDPETLQATMGAGSSTSIAITSSAGVMLSGSGNIIGGELDINGAAAVGDGTGQVSLLGNGGEVDGTNNIIFTQANSGHSNITSTARNLILMTNLGAKESHTISGENGIVMGAGTVSVSGGVYVAAGVQPHSSGTTTVSNSIYATGDISNALNVQQASLVVGQHITSSGNITNAVVLGRNNEHVAYNTTNGQVFAIGGGSSESDRRNIFQVSGSGDTRVSGSLEVIGDGSTLGSTTLSSAAVSDLTSGRVVLAGTGGELQDNGNLTFDGSVLGVSGAITNASTVAATKLTGSFTGSFVGDGSGLTGIASTLTVDGNSGTEDVDLTSDDLQILGTSNEIETSVAKTGTDVQVTIGLPNDVTIGQDLTVNRNLIVKGTASFQHTEDLDIADRFIRMASGSTSAGEGGIVVQQTGPTDGEVFGFVNGSTLRWGVSSSFDASQNTFTPDAYMGIVVSGSAGQAPSAVPSRYTAAGNIFVASDGEIYIYN